MASLVEYLANIAGQYTLYRSVLDYLSLDLTFYLAVPAAHTRQADCRGETHCAGDRGQVVIEQDVNDKPLVDALVQNGLHREQIVLAYAGEVVPELS
jgi:hypothetical protein